MDNTSIPGFEAVPFASGAGAGYRNTVPVTSSGTPGAASYTVGFPPETFQPIASGGIPPSGADFNGVLFDLSKAVRWEQAGGQYPFDATFAGTIGGYPKGAIVLRADGSGQWLNTTNNNSTDPDSGTAAGWIALRANTGIATIAASPGANVPTPTQLGAQVLVVTGSLASAATLTLPLTAGAQWTVINQTTGAGTLTVQGATGSGAQVTQGTGISAFTDGTNYYAITAPLSGAYLPINGTAVAATKLATARAFSLAGVVTAGSVNFDGTGNLTLNTAIADGALSIAKTNGLQAALDAKAPLQSPALTNGQAAASAASALTWAGGGLSTAVRILPRATVGAFNSLVQVNDAAIIFDASSVGYGLSIGPANVVSGGAGLRIAGNGNVSIKGTVTGSSDVVANQNFIAATANLVLAPTGAGAIYLRPNGTGSGTGEFSISSAGNVSVAGSVTATGGFQNSDRRLKKNIKPRDVQRGFALKIARLFSEWDRIADGVHDVGLVAQRVKAIASRYVTRGKKQGRKAGMLGIDKAGIALEASMDCALQLDQQAKTIRTLLRRIEKLEKAR